MTLKTSKERYYWLKTRLNRPAEHPVVERRLLLWDRERGHCLRNACCVRYLHTFLTCRYNHWWCLGCYPVIFVVAYSYCMWVHWNDKKSMNYGNRYHHLAQGHVSTSYVTAQVYTAAAASHWTNIHDYLLPPTVFNDKCHIVCIICEN